MIIVIITIYYNLTLLNKEIKNDIIVTKKVFYHAKVSKTYLLCTISLSATVYENGNSKNTKKWKPYNNVSITTIKNIYDKDKKSRVIFFKSDDSRNGYMLPMERDSSSWCKTKGKSLKWSMSS